MPREHGAGNECTDRLFRGFFQEEQDIGDVIGRRVLPGLLSRLTRERAVEAAQSDS